MQTRHTIQVAGLNKNIQVDLPTRYSQEIKDVQVRGQKKLIEVIYSGGRGSDREGLGDQEDDIINHCPTCCGTCTNNFD